MPLKTSDMILYPSRATTNDVYQGLRNILGVDPPLYVGEFLSELEGFCFQSGLDFSISASHAANETSYFRSNYFKDRRNGFGIGITGQPGVDGPLFPSYSAGAFFYCAEMLLKLRKPLGAFTDARQYAPDKYDQVKALVNDPTFPKIERIADLGKRFGPNNRECTWFCDPTGAEAIVAKANALLPNLPNQIGGTPPVSTGTLNMAKGLIPLPPMISDIIDVWQRDSSGNCRGWDDLGLRPGTPKFLVLHRSVNGPGQSNSGYFHETCCPALTDLEVIAASGQGRRFVELPSHVSGWANGVVSAPYGDALAWLNQHSWDLNTVNSQGEAVEITGNYGDAVSEAAWQWLARWIASRAHDYGITYETFPLIPSEENRSYITWHQEWCLGTGKICPGPVVMNYTSTLLERARAIMADAQTGAGPGKPPDPKPTPVYADPIVPTWMADDLKRGYPTDHVDGGIAYFAALRPYEVLKTANRLQKADPKGAKVGPRLKVRETFIAWYSFTHADRRYVKTPFGTVVDAGALTPRVSVRAA